MSLKIEYSLAVKAAPEVVWRVFAQVERWAGWDPGAMRSARWTSGDAWAAGAGLEIVMSKPMPFTLALNVVEAEAPRLVRLSGGGSGVDVEQQYSFPWDAASASTVLSTEQEFSGMAVTFFGDQVKKPILEGISRMFERIKAEAEGAGHP